MDTRRIRSPSAASSLTGRPSFDSRWRLPNSSSSAGRCRWTRTQRHALRFSLLNGLSQLWIGGQAISEDRRVKVSRGLARTVRVAGEVVVAVCKKSVIGPDVPRTLNRHRPAVVEAQPISVERRPSTPAAYVVSMRSSRRCGRCWSASRRGRRRPRRSGSGTRRRCRSCRCQTR